MRDTLFIGHANPEDDEFTLWLQAKLINEGYKVECDKSFLIGGEEDYWKSLQELLENNTVKYLLVLSKSAFIKQGVKDEWEQVKIIAKKNHLTDFIYILKIDDVPFDVRIGIPGRNHFRFDLSWAAGFKNLNIKLDKDAVIKANPSPLSINDWLKNKFTTTEGIIAKDELYYSNWLQIENLPENLYFYRFTNENQAKVIEEDFLKFPLIRHDIYIISFSNWIPNKFEKYDFEINYLERIEIKSEKAFKKFESDAFPIFEDLKRFMVRLLKQAWNKFLVDKGLHIYQMAGDVKCFHYLKDQLVKDKVFYTYQEKSTYKVLVGDFHEAKWHYGISVSVLLYPISCFILNSHLIFSDDGYIVWGDRKKTQKSRKSKGKSFYNKEWRDLMLAFLASISDDKRNITIQLTKTENLILPVTTVTFNCDFGYNEPSTDGRLVPLDYDEDPENDEEEDVELDNINETNDPAPIT